MQTEEFLRRFLSFGGREISEIRAGWPFRLWMLLAKRTEFMDFGCNFEHGTCRQHKTKVAGEDNPCCCNGCNSAMGHFKSIPQSHIRELARNFKSEEVTVKGRYSNGLGVMELKDKKFRPGFWRPGKGCVLPREYRSVTCVTYHCGGSLVNNPQDILLLKALCTGPGYNLLPRNFLQEHSSSVTYMLYEMIESMHKGIKPRDSELTRSNVFFKNLRCSRSSDGLCRYESIPKTVERSSFLQTAQRRVAYADRSLMRKCSKRNCPEVRRHQLRHEIRAEYLQGMTTNTYYADFNKWIQEFIKFYRNWGTEKEISYPVGLLEKK